MSGRLHARREAPGAVCPDAEILAAYVERTLTPRERAGWETHFSSCARCQEHIGQLVKLGEADEAISAAAPSPARRKKLFGLRWAWAAPILVAVVIAGIWTTGEFKHQLKQTSETGVQLPAPPPAPLRAPETSEAESNKKEAADASRPERRLQAQESAPRRDALRNEPAQYEAAGAVGGLTSGQLRQAPKAAVSSEDSGGRENRVAEAPVPPVAAKPDQPEPAAMADRLAKSSEGAIAPPSERARLQEQATGEISQPKSAGVAAAAAPTTREETPNARDEALAAPSTQSVIVAAPAAGNALSATKSMGVTAGSGGFHYAKVMSGLGNIRQKKSPSEIWRVGPHGLIQEAGAKGEWKTHPSGVEADLYFIAFPSPDVGWVVGQAGTILRTSDGGNTWNRISSPTSDAIVRVGATSAQAAEISTRSGLVFVTSDGGDSWNASSHPQ